MRGGEFQTSGVDRPPTRAVGLLHPVRSALPEERRLLILFGVLWIVIGFVACVLGGER
jgi:hypothetical protein